MAGASPPLEKVGGNLLCRNQRLEVEFDRLARSSRALVLASRQNNLWKSSRRRDTVAHTRDACPTQASAFSRFGSSVQFAAVRTHHRPRSKPNGSSSVRRGSKRRRKIRRQRSTSFARMISKSNRFIASRMRFAKFPAFQWFNRVRRGR